MGSKCITNNSHKLSQETMSVSPSETSPLKTSREVTFALMKRTTQPEKPPPSTPKLSFLTTLTRSETDTPQFWIATLLANSKPSSLKLTEELVKPLKKTQNSSNPVMPLWLNCSQPNQ